MHKTILTRRLAGAVALAALVFTAHTAAAQQPNRIRGQI